MNQIQSHAAKGEILTGLLYLNPEAKDLHAHLNTDHRPLNSLRAEDLCPGTAALERLNASLR
jgi:2-oxoglutarate ferredoxin oxidoreductase subunit beta